MGKGFDSFCRAGVTRRFSNVIRSATGQSLNGDAPSALGERAAHDDRHAEPATAEHTQSREPIHNRHLDIEQDQIGAKIFERAQCGCAVGCGANDLEIRFHAKNRTQEIPHHRRIIHDEDARRPA